MALPRPPTVGSRPGSLTVFSSPRPRPSTPFPPPFRFLSEQGVNNLFPRMKKMVSYGPQFCDITWGAGGSTADLTQDIANRMQKEVGIETMMHLTCTNMMPEKVTVALEKCKEAGIENILALRGDPPKGKRKVRPADQAFFSRAFMLTQPSPYLSPSVNRPGEVGGRRGRF